MRSAVLRLTPEKRRASRNKVPLPDASMPADSLAVGCSRQKSAALCETKFRWPTPQCRPRTSLSAILVRKALRFAEQSPLPDASMLAENLAAGSSRQKNAALRLKFFRSNRPKLQIFARERPPSGKICYFCRDERPPTSHFSRVRRPCPASIACSPCARLP